METVNATLTEDTGSPEPFTLVLLLIIEILAIACTFIILPYFFFHWQSMITKALHNHAIFLLIIISFLYITMDLPFNIHYYRVGYDYPRTSLFCLWWHWFDFTLLVSSLFLTATASIQRHILIFNSNSLRVRRARWIKHYIPLIICLIYPPIFYLAIVFFYPCVTEMDEDSRVCSDPCYSDERILSYFEWIFNIISPVVIIVLANIALVYRVIRTMRELRRRQSSTWQKHKKLTLQLFAFSSLYVLGWGPATLVNIVEKFFIPDLFDVKPNLYYINNSNYFICPLQCCICIFALPDLMNFIKIKLMRILKKSATTPIQTISRT